MAQQENKKNMETINKHQNILCFLGHHKYKILEVLDVKQLGYDTEIGKMYVLQCMQCGKIKEKFIRTKLTSNY